MYNTFHHVTLMLFCGSHLGRGLGVRLCAIVLLVANICATLHKSAHNLMRHFNIVYYTSLKIYGFLLFPAL